MFSIIPRQLLYVFYHSQTAAVCFLSFLDSCCMFSIIPRQLLYVFYCMFSIFPRQLLYVFYHSQTAVVCFLSFLDSCFMFSIIPRQLLYVFYCMFSIFPRQLLYVFYHSQTAVVCFLSFLDSCCMFSIIPRQLLYVFNHSQTAVVCFLLYVFYLSQTAVVCFYHSQTAVVCFLSFLDSCFMFSISRRQLLFVFVSFLDSCIMFSITLLYFFILPRQLQYVFYLSQTDVVCVQSFLDSCCMFSIFRRQLLYVFPIRNFLGNIKVLRWACNATSDFCGTDPLIIVGLCLAYVAFIEGSFPQCCPQYIAVFGGTIPLLVRIMWALHMHYPGHFPHCTQEIIMDFFIENPLLIAYLVPYYLPNLYPCIFHNPIPTPLLGYLPTLIPYNLICLFKNNNGFLQKLH